MARPLILLSNDDGFRAEGIRALRASLARVADVILCAPESEQSASSHALSLNRPLRLVEHEPSVFSVSGTPADSVYVALYSSRVLPRKPDIVVAGLNHGLNLGLDVFYSGTVAAAREGALQGLPAIAFSASAGADLEASAECSANLTMALLATGRGGPALFNVNYPPGDSWALRSTRLGRRVYSGGLVERADPRGQPYLWIGGAEVWHEDAPGSDTEAFDQGVVGVTPLVLDLWSSHLEDTANALVSAWESQGLGLLASRAGSG